MRRALLGACLGLAAAAPAAAAPCRGVRLGDQQLLIEAADVHEAFPEIDAKLAKGLTVTLINQAEWEGRPPLTFGCKIFYDLWDANYDVAVIRGALTGAGDERKVREKSVALSLCVTAKVPAGAYGAGAFTLTSQLNPVSDEVLAKTRQWLAEKGISGSSGAIFGRAAYAIMDLRQQEAIRRRCEVLSPDR